jgi:hypothetical protein
MHVETEGVQEGMTDFQFKTFIKLILALIETGDITIVEKALRDIIKDKEDQKGATQQE